MNISLPFAAGSRPGRAGGHLSRLGEGKQEGWRGVELGGEPGEADLGPGAGFGQAIPTLVPMEGSSRETGEKRKQYIPRAYNSWQCQGMRGCQESPEVISRKRGERKERRKQKGRLGTYIGGLTGATPVSSLPPPYPSSFLCPLLCHPFPLGSSLPTSALWELCPAQCSFSRPQI